MSSISHTMCDRCQVKATAYVTKGGLGIFHVYIFRLDACKHHPNCCDGYERYREDNSYADKGIIFENRPVVKYRQGVRQLV